MSFSSSKAGVRLHGARSIGLAALAALFFASLGSGLFFSTTACGTSSSSGTGGSGGHAKCSLPDIGDTSKPIEVEMLILGLDGTSTVVKDGDVVPIITPPQGGRVIFAGARAKNLNPCGVDLKGVILDDQSKNMGVTVDERTVNLHAEPDGWGASVDSNISTFANVAVCGNTWSTRDVFDQPYTLEVDVTDKSGRKGKAIVHVKPTCAETDPTLHAECLCICKANYMLGSCTTM